MSVVRVGPGDVPSRESPEQAIELLGRGGYDACEIDLSSGFWMDRDYAHRFGSLARDAGIALSIHAPLAAFLGHVDATGRKRQMAVGMLDHSAGIAVACGAAPIVIHPGFLLGRARQQAIDAVVQQLGDLHERLVAKDRGVPFGIEVMGRVQELGSLDDVVTIAGHFDWVRPVIDFAHMHATSDGGFTSVEPFVSALAKADAVLRPGIPFHIHFSDVSFANRNEKAHLPYGQGTLRAEPLGAALTRFERPATVISESPDEPSNQAIKTALTNFSLTAALRDG
ncbi:MAG: TIM barrel protein [Chloroflexi bacterium]|nr:MAG: TIM barrel protein [Chloroflexota bacterium]TME44807.1 MAG: TIM barrel protein [Chloroflexota bacterium]